MSSNIKSAVAPVVATLTVLGILGTARPPRAQSTLSLVYVESNIGSVSNDNSVFGFSNDGSGNLTPLPGSPYLANGTGVYDPSNTSSAFDADQEVVTSPDGNLLFAVNGHSNTIAVFNINSDGTLTSVSGSPFASGGQDPASIGLAWEALPKSASAVVIVNKNDDPNQNNQGTVPNYTNFTTNSNGVPTPVTNGTINLAFESSPAQAYVTERHLVFGLEFGTSRLVSYSLQSNGSMVQVSAVNPPSSGEQFLGEWSLPQRPILYAGIPLPGPDLVGVYEFSGTGELSFAGSVSNNGDAICWLRVNSEGTRLYTAESHSETLSVYDTTHPFVPSMMQQITISGHPSNLSLDPTGQFLYVLADVDLHILNVLSNGTLSETVPPVSLNVPAGEHPLGVAVAMK